MTDLIRAVIADDHPIVLEGLKALLRADAGIAVVGEARNAAKALELIKLHRPDVAILDIAMPGQNGIMLAKQVAVECRSVCVIVLTAHEDTAYVQQALHVGVRGYVLKRSLAGNLLQAIRAVLEGGTYVDSAIQAQILGVGRATLGKRTDGALPALTEREKYVLRLIALGQTNKEIAQQLGIGVKTVETFKARACSKLELRTRAEIVRFAVAQNWFGDA